MLKASSIGLDILANELLEHADTRSSLMLPGRVYLARIPVSHGRHTIKMEYLDASGSIIGSDKREIEVYPENAVVEMFTAMY